MEDEDVQAAGLKQGSLRLVGGLALCLSAAAAACVAPVDLPDPGSDDAPIVGGMDVNISLRPWQIDLRGVSGSAGSHFCGASIISDSWILTAQHCVEDYSADVLVVAGITDLSAGGSGQIRNIDIVTLYPGYSAAWLGADAAMLHVDPPLDLSGPDASAIALVDAADAAGGLTDPGVLSTITGWGALWYGGPSPDTLQTVDIPLISNADAQAAYPMETITPDQLGAGIIGVGGVDSCQGDSGGPLVVPDGMGGYKLAGIVSWGYDCADPAYPGLYGRVSSFEPWIVERMGATISVEFDSDTESHPSGTWQHRAITVPAGAMTLSAVMGGGSGDMDLYVREGAQPTMSSWDCRPYLFANEEFCSFDSPNPGTWYVSTRAYSSPSNVSLTVTVLTPPGMTGDSDGDGVDDPMDTDPADPFVCRDTDGDTCDDCTNTGADGSGGDPANDGTDTDGDGLCNAGDPDNDNDGVPDGMDVAPNNPNLCRDVDGDTCDDCVNTGANGSGGDPTNDGTDTDGDGLCNAGDPDNDNDGVPDGPDSNPNNPFLCLDTDGDGCDDCTNTGADLSGGDPLNDGPDADGDGICDGGDTDDDNDGVVNGMDTDPANPYVCQDTDGDSCDDCVNTGPDGSGGDPANDGVDTDGDGLCNPGDPDNDNDGVPDGPDTANNDPYVCLDTDGDGCDDCTNTGPDLSGGDPANDGPDTDGDGLCNAGDPDNDNDGVPDGPDSNPNNPNLCQDTDGDGCDDCTNTGADGSGGDPFNDGPDADGDGYCDGGDTDDDNDGVVNGLDVDPADPFVCQDTDGDSCDDCTNTGADGSGGDPSNDGPDADGNGICDAGEPPPPPPPPGDGGPVDDVLGVGDDPDIGDPGASAGGASAVPPPPTKGRGEPAVDNRPEDFEPPGDDPAGCGCSVPGSNTSPTSGAPVILLLTGAAVAMGRRRKKRREIP